MSTATILRGEVRCARKVMLRDPTVCRCQPTT